MSNDTFSIRSNMVFLNYFLPTCLGCAGERSSDRSEKKALIGHPFFISLGQKIFLLAMDDNNTPSALIHSEKCRTSGQFCVRPNTKDRPDSAWQFELPFATDLYRKLS